MEIIKSYWPDFYSPLFFRKSIITTPTCGLLADTISIELDDNHKLKSGVAKSENEIGDKFPAGIIITVSNYILLVTIPILYQSTSQFFLLSQHIGHPVS